MKVKKFLSVLLILSLMFALSKFCQAQAQTQYSLDLQRITWSSSTISVLITTPTNESWWAPSYLNATLRAISEWNNAILDFASNYTDWAYLSQVEMTPTIAYTVVSGFDVYISWTETSPSAADEIGYTNTLYSVPDRIIINSTIDLASETFQGYVLNEVDMQNLALHEVGHSLGLSHSNTDDDVMYPKLTLTPLNQVQGLSTLDLYGVSTVFQWISNSSSPHISQKSSVTLPSNITYRHLPISDEDLPSASPYSSLWQTLQTYILKLINYTTDLISRPEILVVLIVISVLLVITLLYARLQKARKTSQDVDAITSANRDNVSE